MPGSPPRPVSGRPRVGPHSGPAANTTGSTRPAPRESGRIPCTSVPRGGCASTPSTTRSDERPGRPRLGSPGNCRRLCAIPVAPPQRGGSDRPSRRLGVTGGPPDEEEEDVVAARWSFPSSTGRWTLSGSATRSSPTSQPSTTQMTSRSASLMLAGAPDHGLTISAGKMSGLWSGAPASIKLADLDVICVVLGCDVGELLVAEPDKVQRPVEDGNDQLAATTSSSSSGGPPVTPKRRDGRSLPPL